MTTSDPTVRRTRWWGSVPWSAVLVLGFVVGLVVFFVMRSALELYLVNVYGPYSDEPGHGSSMSLWFAALAASCVALVLVVAGRLTSLLLVPALVAVVACSSLYPDQIDQHESWVEEPNPRWSCRGFVFEYYPPGYSDYDSTVYCVGLETPRSDG